MMPTLYRTFLVGLTVLAIASVAVAQKTSLIVWGLSITADEKGTDALVREFESRNPDIHVRLMSLGAGEMNPQKLMTAIVGNTAPDVIQQDRFSISDWASRGAFTELDPLIERDRKTDPATPTADQYYPAVWQEACFGGKVYGIPTGADDRILYWNKKIFNDHAAELRSAGLDPTRPPRTWSETLAYSKVLTERNPDGSLKVAGFIPNFGNSWLYLYSFQLNGTFMSPDGKKCTLNTPINQRALQFMLDGYELLGGKENVDRFQAGFRDKENDPFLAGKVSMVVNGDWVIDGYNRYGPTMQFGTAPVPVPDSRFNHTEEFANEKDTFVTWAGGGSYAIPRGAKHLEAAWKFIKFNLSQEGRLISLKANADLARSKGRRYIPKISAHRATNEVELKMFAQGPSPFEQALRTHVEMMKYARVRPETMAAQLLWDEHVRATDQALLKARTIPKALQEGQEKVQRILDEYNSVSTLPIANVGAAFLVGGIVLVGAIVALGVYIYRQRLGRIAREEARAGYLFIAPWILGFVVFTVGPMFASLFLSFTVYNVLSPPRWVGFKNYSDLWVGDASILAKNFENVAYVAGIGIPLGMATGLAIAMLLNTGVRGLRYYRTIYYLPAIVPTVASIVLWQWLFNPDAAKGLFNQLWRVTVTSWFGVNAPGWFSVEAWAKPALIMMGLWGAGSGMILWLAGLKGVPTTLYEAASIDGASARQQFFGITLPQLSPLIFFNSVMGVIATLQTFDSVYVITQGGNTGPNDALAMPVYHLFNSGFRYFRMGYASALAWAIFAIILILTFGQFVLSKRWVHYEVQK